MTDPIDDFVYTLGSLSPETMVSVDRADDPVGEVFIDIAGPGRSVTVSYSPRVGFGFFAQGAVLGERPVHFVSSAQEAARLAAGVPDKLPSHGLGARALVRVMPKVTAVAALIKFVR